ARSTDLSAAVTMTAAMLANGLTAGPLMTEMTKMTATMLDFSSPSPAQADAGVLLGGAGGVLALAGGVVVAVLAAAVGASLVQTGLLAVGQLFSPDLSRLAPGAGLARMFSARAAMRGLMALAKIALVGGIGVWAIWGNLGEFAAVGLGGEAAQLAGRIVRPVWLAGMGMSLTLLALGVLDWLYQRWQFRREHRMTPRELADELQNTETYKQLRRRTGQAPAPAPGGIEDRRDG
ncbi:MAG: EscU/YscU/HrcU family type III secretion system export apparatus switch protein, partial [Planctomycetota bacterium]|nr:EscU/YscU/HrcU family type III secretion system export apparatus switch protein [Planctomycetota bacterium]